MRLPPLFALTVLLLSPSAVAQTEPFATAKPQPSESITPKRFLFAARSWECSVSAEGSGTCQHGSRRWRFRLPVDDGRIDTLHFQAGEPLVLVYSLTDEESSWGKAIGLNWGARRPRWKADVGGLNAAVPVVSAGTVVVGALGFVASLDRANGTFSWRHEYVYDGAGRTDINLEVREGVVALTARVPWRLEDLVKTCYSLETGMIASCR